MELEALKEVAADIVDLGAGLAVISPQLEKYNVELVKEKNITFPVLSDPGNRVAGSYGVVYQMSEELKAVYTGFGIILPEYNGDDSWTLPMPTRLVVDQAGFVRYVQSNIDHTVRPDPRDTVEFLKTL